MRWSGGEGEGGVATAERKEREVKRGRMEGGGVRGANEMEEEEEEGEAGCAARGAAVGSGANGGRIAYTSIAVESFCCGC